MKETENCPCGSETSFALCCGRYLNGSTKAETAEQLMRSRYSAYVKENESYLKNTWHEKTRPTRIEFDSGIKWTRLSIKNTNNGDIGDDQGTVEFVATYKNNGRAFRLHENSQFIRDNGNWFYLGVVNSDPES